MGYAQGMKAHILDTLSQVDAVGLLLSAQTPVSEFEEPSATEYKRQAIRMKVDGRTVMNDTRAQFPRAPGRWGKPAAFGLFRQGVLMHQLLIETDDQAEIVRNANYTVESGALRVVVE